MIAHMKAKLATLFVLTMAAVGQPAQDADPNQPRPKQLPDKQAFEKADVDKDGSLTKEEFEQFLKANRPKGRGGKGPNTVKPFDPPPAGPVNVPSQRGPQR